MSGGIHPDWNAWVDQQQSAIVGEGRWRSIKIFDALGQEGLLHTDKEIPKSVVSFASNDYLGLTSHPEVIAAAHAAIDRWGTGAGASRLVVGTRPIHQELESTLATWKHCEAAVVFSTGYAANLGVLSTFGVSGVKIFSDELNHASIIDGCRLAGGDVAVFKHGDMDHLGWLLKAVKRESHCRTIVVSDAVFSMDGDEAPIEDLIEVSERYGSLLILDEAHGVLGPDVTKEPADANQLLRMGTLSKTLGSIGGFIAGPRSYIDLIINRARSFIFTTALTPSDAASALAALNIVCSSEGDALRARLRSFVERLKPGHPSPIVPIILGTEEAALRVSQRLLDVGLWVPAIRPPTVPEGSSRLRIALSASHRTHEIDDLARELAQLGLPS